MFEERSIGGYTTGPGTLVGISVVLVLINLIFSIVANAGFRESDVSDTTRGFLTWQLIGNLCGLATVLTLTAVLRFIPLHVAFPITTGLAVIGVASYALFHESISRYDWVGSVFVVVGIVLIGRGS